MNDDAGDLVLRPFAATDDAELSSWFSSAGELRFFSNRRLTWPPTSQQWESIRRDPTVHALTATLSTNPVQIGHGEIVEKSSMSVGIERVAISPAWRGRGYGRWIVAALLGRARSAGYSHVRQVVHRDNASAVRLYRGLGFVQYSIEGEPNRVALEMTFPDPAN